MKFVITWFAAMSWHLWRIATLRPYFKGLGDTAVTAVSFFVVYVASSLIRWAGFADAAIAAVIFSDVLHFFVLCLALERTGRSSSLLFVALGASAFVDLAAVLVSNVIDVSVESQGFLAIEIMLYARAAYCFSLEPYDVRSAGYKRKPRIEPIGE